MFAATGTSTSLGGYIDDVRLTQPLEPVTLSLPAIGLLGVGARRFRASELKGEATTARTATTS